MCVCVFGVSVVCVGGREGKKGGIGCGGILVGGNGICEGMAVCGACYGVYGKRCSEV